MKPALSVRGKGVGNGWWWLALAGLGMLACPLVLVPARAAEPAPASQIREETPAQNDRIERQFKLLMELDDEAQAEVDAWIQAAQTNRIGDAGIQQGILSARIQDRLEPVRKAYEAFLARHPDHARARLAYAGFLRDLGRDQEARLQLEKAKELAPDLPAVWNNLGNYYGHNGPATNAFACYEKAIQLNPNEALYYGNLARTIHLFPAEAGTYYRLSLPATVAKAQALYRKALELDPSNFVMATELAQTYYALKPAPPKPGAPEPPSPPQLAEEALAAWEAALKLAGDDLEREGVRIHMARWQIEMGRLEAARQSLSKVQARLHQAAKEELEKALRSPPPPAGAKEKSKEP